MPNRLKIHGGLFLVALIYGANYSIAKVALGVYLAPFGFILLRITGATILFWVLGLFTKKEPIQNRNDFYLLGLCSLFGVAATQMLFFKGLSLTNPINASVIMTISPIMVMIVAYFLGKERLSLIRLLGVVIGGVGAYLLLAKDGMSLNQGTFLGDFIVLINGTCYAVYLVIVKPLMSKYNALTVVKWIFLMGIFYTIPFGLDELLAVQWHTMPATAWLSVFYVIICTTFMVFLINGWALRYVNSSVVGTYIYLQPIISTVIAVSFRGDVLDLPTIFYALLIMIGVYLVSRF